MQQEIITREMRGIPANLITLDKVDTETLFQPGGTEFILEMMETEIVKRSKNFDVSTENGRAFIRSTAAQIATLRCKIDNYGKDYVAELKARPKIIDAERKRFRDYTEMTQVAVREPLTKYEQAVEARAQRVKDMRALVMGTTMTTFVLSVVDVDARIAKLTELYKDYDFEESQVSANDSWEQIGGMLASLREKAVTFEKEQAELEDLRIRQIEQERLAREEEIRQAAFAEGLRQAEEQRKREEQAILAAQMSADAPYSAPDSTSIDDLSDNELQSHLAKTDEYAEFDAFLAGGRSTPTVIEAAMPALIVDKETKCRIHREIMAAFLAAGLSQEAAQIAGKAIIAGSIPKVSINYAE